MFCAKKDRTILSIPTEDQLDYSGLEDVWEKDIQHLKTHKKNYVEIEKMESRRAFQVMEQFADEVPDIDIQYRLRKALQGKKPFMNFRRAAEWDAHYWEEWNKFKRRSLTEWVGRRLRDHQLL